MNDAFIDANKQSKRCLPTWMQSINASKNEKIGNLDELCSTSGIKTRTQGVVSMIESFASQANVQVSDKENVSEIKESFTENYSKKGTKKPKKCEDSEDSACKLTGAKRKIKGEIGACQKFIDTQTMKLKSRKNKFAKVLSQRAEDDETELTVEDLITIAKEVLTSEKEKQNEQTVVEESEPSEPGVPIPTSSSEPSVSWRGKLGGPIRPCQVLTKHTQTNSSINQIEGKCGTIASSNKVKQTEDAAHDMLEVFLGPLLKSAAAAAAPNKEVYSISRLPLASSVYESDSEKQAPLMKKKGSLKDKVAILLD